MEPSASEDQRPSNEMEFLQYAVRESKRNINRLRHDSPWFLGVDRKSKADDAPRLHAEGSKLGLSTALKDEFTSFRTDKSIQAPFYLL